MKKYYLLAIFLLQLNSVLAVTRYWIGSIGNYSDGVNWNTQSNGSGVAGAPVNTDDIIIDRNATINIDGIYSPSSCWIVNNAIVNFTNNSGSVRVYTIGGAAFSPSFKIDAGSTLNIIGNTTLRLTIAPASTASIFGVLDITGNGSTMDYTFGTGVTTVKTGGKIRYGGNSGNGSGSISTLLLEAGSTYEIYKNGGIFPTATYDPNSLILNTGAITDRASFSMNAATGSYGNYEFNSPSNLGNFLGFNNNYTFNNFSIINAGIGTWVYSTAPSASYTLTVNGNLSINANCTLDINRASSGSQLTTIIVKGNLLNNGLITETSGNIGALIELGGNANTSFSTVQNGITNDVSMKINKVAGTSVTALTDITLPNTNFSKLTLTSGHFDMQANDKLLFLQNPTFNSLIGGSVDSYIIGKFKRNSIQVGEYSFPVSNNAVQFAKATITTNSTNATEWLVEFIPVNANSGAGLTPGVIDVVANYIWNISRTGATPSNAAFITLFYGDLTTSQVLIPAQAKVVHWNGTSWDNVGGVGGGGNVQNTLGSTGAAAPGDPITTFSQFSIGGIVGVIPISIEYFKGLKRNNEHLLSWKVNCSNTRDITLHVERSADGRKFNSIYSITANALRCLQPFDKTDLNPLPGLNYYRLKVTDGDGKVSYGSTIALLNQQRGIEIISLSPNPVPKDGNAILNITSAQKDLVKIVIADMTGKQVSVQKNVLIIAGSNQLPLNLFKLSSGNYLLTIFTSQGNKITQSFIKE